MDTKRNYGHSGYILIFVLILNGIYTPLPVSATRLQAANDFSFPFTETFKNATAPGWVLGGNTGALLTSGGADPAGDGWLRLTGKTTNQTGFAYYDTPILTNRGLVIAFDYASWGGSGADGLVFYLFDGATTTFRIGGFGGSLGYAQRTGILGLSNGYAGIGIDEFGNYSNPTEGRVGGPGSRRDAVAIRGPGNGATGYAYLTGSGTLASGIDTPSVATRPSQTGSAYRKVTITLEPIGSTFRISVKIQFGFGAPAVEVIAPYTLQNSAPTTLKLGFGASTGGSTNYHEIRNLTITPKTPDIISLKSVEDLNGGNVAPGDELRYTIQLNNQTSSDINGIRLVDAIPANTSFVANSLIHPQDPAIVVSSENPTLDITGLTVPGSGQTQVSFRVRVHSPWPVGVTQISNQATVTVNGVDQLTDSDTTQSGSQPSVISVTAGPNFSQASKTVTLSDVNGDGAVSPLDILNYQVILPNTGDQNALQSLFHDVLPANTTYISSSASNGSVSYNTSLRRIEWLNNINAGAQVILNFSVRVNSGVLLRDLISNQGSLSYDSDGNGSRDVTILTDGDLSSPGRQPTEVLVGGRIVAAVTKTVEDLNGGSLVPGDILRYTVQLNNLSSFAIVGAGFSDAIPYHTAYAPGSATIPSGSTLAATDPILQVNSINIPSYSQVGITFDVTLNNPLPAGVIDITNQGMLFYDANGDATNDTSLASDADPTQAGQQPTRIAVSAAADFSGISKIVTLLDDADLNGVPSPGDTLAYQMSVPNSGNQDAAAVTLTDGIPAGTTFLAGSLAASSGSISFNSGANQVEWNGDIAAGSTVVIGFQVTIDPGLPVGTVISNQAFVNHASVSTPSDDPSHSGLQPTEVTTGGEPEVQAVKTVVDLNGGSLVPGDILEYGVVLNNTSVYDLNGFEFFDTMPAHTSFVAGSLVSSGGDLVTTAPVLHLKNLSVAAGGNANVTFHVLVDDPLPAGVTTIRNQGVVSYTVGVGDIDNHLTDSNPALAGEQVTEIPVFAAPAFDIFSKSVAVVTGADGIGAAMPANELLYTISFANTGNQGVAGVVLTDTIPTNTAYVSGSLSASSGSALYQAGANRVEWTGDVPVGEVVNLSFRVIINDGTPTGTTLTNQAWLGYDNNDDNINDSNAWSDADPLTAGSQSTDIVTVAPDIIANKTASLVVDHDLDHEVSPGDRIRYMVSIHNRGLAAATGMILTDIPDPNSTLVAGSVWSGQGSVTTGNNPGDTSIAILVGTLDVGATVTITFDVDAPIGIGGIDLSNQGQLTGSNFVTFYTDDPNTPLYGDPTLTEVEIEPHMTASKTIWPSLVLPFIDADFDGDISPGDTLKYVVTLCNVGESSAANVLYRDEPDPNTDLVVGSVTSTQGVATWGNSLGDTNVQVDLGFVTAGATVTVTYQVLIRDPLPFQVVTLTNQGLLSGSNIPPVDTDDPTTPDLMGDATVTVVEAGELGNLVWKDTNGNGLYDGGELPFENATVNLEWAGPDNLLSTVDDNGFGTTRTDPDGNYEFGGLPSGNYRISFAAIEGFRYSPSGGDSTPDPSTGEVSGIVLGRDEKNFTFDAGFVSDLIFGDLPDSFQMTTLAQDGARHIAAGLYLGDGYITGSDGEPTNTPRPASVNDGVNRVFSETWAPGNTVTLNIRVTGGGGYLVGWFDWNNDGNFTGMDERILFGSVLGGDATLNLSIPVAYTTGQPIFARFRLYDYNPTDPQATGLVFNGEVEDYQWVFRPTAVDLLDFQTHQETYHLALLLAILGLVISLPAGLSLARARLRIGGKRKAARIPPPA